MIFVIVAIVVVVFIITVITIIAIIVLKKNFHQISNLCPIILNPISNTVLIPFFDIFCLFQHPWIFPNQEREAHRMGSCNTQGEVFSFVIALTGVFFGGGTLFVTVTNGKISLGIL